tara:strand:+ start:307 stop:507 length:201 start_codon:yes stop_codon:yes gene_type:complete
VDVLYLVFNNKKHMIKFFKSLCRSKGKTLWTCYPEYAKNEHQKMEFMAEVWEEMETNIKIKNNYDR